MTGRVCSPRTLNNYVFFFVCLVKQQFVTSNEGLKWPQKGTYRMCCAEFYVDRYPK